MSTFPTIKTGDIACYDAIQGPISVRILSITTSVPNDTRPASWQKVTAEVTEGRPGFPKGCKLEGWGLHFFPRSVLKGNRIGAYRVIADDPTLGVMCGGDAEATDAANREALETVSSKMLSRREMTCNW